MSIIESLEAIEQAARGNVRADVAKQEILASNSLRKVICDTVDPFVTFGVQKLPQTVDIDPPFENDDHWLDNLLVLGESLAKRELTGHKAQSVISHFRGRCDDRQRKWADRYILRDLRLDLGAKTIQKIVGKDLLKLFDVPLATDYAKVKKIEGRYVVQPKYDGARVVAFIYSLDEIVLKSRTGKVWKNFEPIERAVREFAKASMVPVPYVLDGEVVAVDENGEIDFQAVQKVLMRKDGIVDTHLQYIVFDGCSHDEWVNPQQNYETRLKLLQNTFDQIDEDCPLDIELTEFQMLELSPSSSRNVLRDLAQDYVLQRYEGGIARKAGVIVQNKRTTDLLKIKAFQDAEAQVVGVIEGTGKYLGMLGALQCELPDGKKFDMGSGFTDIQREKIWNGLNMGYANFDGAEGSILGCLVTFKFFETTNDGVPRFPIFKSVRHVADVSVTDEDEEAA